MTAWKRRSGKGSKSCCLRTTWWRHPSTRQAEQEGKAIVEMQNPRGQQHDERPGRFPAAWKSASVAPVKSRAIRRIIASAKDDPLEWSDGNLAKTSGYSEGTFAVARRSRSDRKEPPTHAAFSGGDTRQSAHTPCRLVGANRVTYISTGCGASLEFREGKVLPGVAALI